MVLSLNKKLPIGKRRAVNHQNLVNMAPLDPAKPLPLVVRPATDGVDLCAWARANRDDLDQRLLQHGGILFRGFDVGEVEHLEAFIEAISGSLLEYKERSSPRHEVKGNIYTSTDHPANQHIFLHNENSYQKAWPMKIFFMCVTVPGSGGETPVADCRKVLQRIDPAIRDQLVEKGFRIVRNYGSGMGLPWQTVFQTEDRAVVDDYCRQNGVSTEWKADGGLRTVTHRPAVARHPRTGEPIWFNHGTFFHITTLDDALAEVLMASMDEADLPTNTYWGDGTPFEDKVLDHLRKAYRDEAVIFPWQKGDILMLDNMLAAHAREPFTGERKVVVGMSEAIVRGPETEYRPPA